MAGEWVGWHDAYDAGGARALRLEAVRALIRRDLDLAAPGPVRVVSLCAGDGRDLLGVLARHPRASDVRARLVEIEPVLVDRGRAEADRLGLTKVSFLRGDAALRESYVGAVPADLALVCGIFGNIPDQEVRATIDHLPELLAPGARVIWTRGRFEPNLVPDIRRWFADSGFEEIAYAEILESTATVGYDRLRATPRPLTWHGPLFRFLPKGDRPSSQAPDSV